MVAAEEMNMHKSLSYQSGFNIFDVLWLILGFSCAAEGFFLGLRHFGLPGAVGGLVFGVIVGYCSIRVVRSILARFLSKISNARQK